MRARSEDYNYDYLTEEEYQALDWDASLSITCHSEDGQWAGLLSLWLFERGFVSTEDGFSVLQTDADLGFHIRAVSVRELTENDIMDLEDVFRSLPWERKGMVNMHIRRNDFSNWELRFG